MLRPIRPKPLIPTLIAMFLLSEFQISKFTSILCNRRMYRIYTWALRLGLTVISPYYLLGSRRYWPTLSDRLGRLKLPQLDGTIWIHAVSVGEVRAAEKLLSLIRQQFP